MNNSLHFRKIEDWNEIFSIIDSIDDVKQNIEKRIDVLLYSKKMVANAQCFVLEELGGMKCFSATYCNDNISKTAFITLIACAKDCRNSGFGSIMLNYIFEVAKTFGMQKLKLEVDKDNETAIRFYHKHGLKIVSLTQNGYLLEKDI